MTCEKTAAAKLQDYITRLCAPQQQHLKSPAQAQITKHNNTTPASTTRLRYSVFYASCMYCSQKATI
ncbi:hypothetical protein [Polynucleobacter antarcticus]|uniref:hypothetical protein n=1 Tax=Polynucleobacter antarcticus TaxID=1743162 RepID=UPI00156EF3CF|nr:hypothetical protein [Polynucleobacter antarcticus]